MRKRLQLVQFAKNGVLSIWRIFWARKDPARRTIVNIGIEEEKGNCPWSNRRYPLLKECKDINFIGRIECTRRFKQNMAMRMSLFEKPLWAMLILGDV